MNQQTNNEAFEKWEQKTIQKITGMQGWTNHGWAESAWQAARQQPLKRIDYNRVSELIPEGLKPASAHILDFYNAIMDEMERINRE